MHLICIIGQGMASAAFSVCPFSLRLISESIIYYTDEIITFDNNENVHIASLCFCELSIVKACLHIFYTMYFIDVSHV